MVCLLEKMYGPIKKCLLSFFSMLLMVGTVQAAGIIDPVNILEKNKFSLGLEAGYLSEFDFENTTANATRHISDGTVEKYQYDVTNLRIEDDLYSFLSLNYGLMDKITLVVKAGMVTDGKKSSGSNPDNYYKLHDNFVWALGGKINLWESENGGILTFSTQYQRYDNRSQHRAWISSWATDFEIDFWQVDASLVGAWRFSQITPYLGIKYTRTELRLTGTSTGVVSGLTRSTHSDYTSNNEDNIGAVAGIAWAITPAWRVLVQGDFVVETAGTISLGYQF